MRSFLATAALLLSGLGGASFSAPAMAVSLAHDYTFYFSGVCEDCGLPLVGGEYGPGLASGTLSLTNYMLGDGLTIDNVSSFTFTSDKLGTVVSDLISGVKGKLSTPQAGNDRVGLNFMAGIYSYSFNTGYEGGYWSMNEYDYGYSHTWTAAPVPEPETYAMMMAGLGLIGMVARRRKSKQQ